MTELSLRTDSFATAMSFLWAIQMRYGDTVVAASIAREGSDWPLRLTLSGPRADEAYREILHRVTARRSGGIEIPAKRVD